MEHYDLTNSCEGLNSIGYGTHPHHIDGSDEEGQLHQPHSKLAL